MGIDIQPRPASGLSLRRPVLARTRPALAVAALAGLVACDRSPKVSAAPKPPAVTVVAVAQRSVPVYGQYVGQTEAVKTVEVRARVEGFLERQAAPDGATVKAGDLLFTIDPRPYQAALDAAKADLFLAQANLNRQSKLEAKDVTATQDVDTAKASAMRAEAAVAAAAAPSC